MNRHKHTPHGLPHHPDREHHHDDFREGPGPTDGPRGRRRGSFGGHPRGGPEGHDRGHRHDRQSRRRGAVRVAVLLLLAEESMHGYQLMQTIAERTDGAWSPSPGAIYPTLNQLEDEGLVHIDTSGGRKEVSLTEAGAPGRVAQPVGDRGRPPTARTHALARRGRAPGRSHRNRSPTPAGGQGTH